MNRCEICDLNRGESVDVSDEEGRRISVDVCTACIVDAEYTFLFSQFLEAKFDMVSGH